MAAIEIFRLFGSVFIDNEKADQALDKTDKKAAGLASTFTSGVSAAAKWAAGIAAAVGGIVLLANTTADSADKIDKMSIRTGISRTQLQELQFVTSQTGVSFESLQSAVARMTQTLGKADADGKAAAAVFERLGISVHDSSGALRDCGAVFNEALLALAEMENKTERNVLAQQLFGRGAIELVPLLDQGAAGIADLTARAHELGLVMSDEAIRAGVEYKDAMDELKRSTAALKNDAMMAIIPVIKDVVSWLTNLIVQFRSLDPEQQRMIVTIGGVVLAAGPLVKILNTLHSGVSALGSIVTGVFTAATSPVGLAVLAIGALVAAGVMLYKHWDEVKAWAQQTWERIKGIIKGAIDPILGWIDGLIGAVRRAIDWVRNLVGLNREASTSTPAAPAPVSYGEVPQMAGGGSVVDSGLALVGERGPELLHLPRGAQVIPLAQTASPAAVINIHNPVIWDDYGVRRLMEQAMQQLELAGVATR